tara:strand:- start:498 stop:1250 length:753 start_codon:yes stop_codon:yes gene_type:complete
MNKTNWQDWTNRLKKTPLPALSQGLGAGLAIQGVNQIRKNPLGIRDAFLNKIGTPEHYKRFAQYLTGGVKDDVVTELPRNILLDVVGEHVRGAYPDRDKTINATNKDGSKLTIANPSYDPNSTQLSTYGSDYTGSMRTAGSLGNTGFIPVKDEQGNLTGYRIKDTYDVDPDPDYKAWKSPHHADLVEGGWLAARAHDVAKKLGTAKDFKYDVFIPINQFNELKNEINSKTQIQRNLDTSRLDKRAPHKIR